MGLIVAAAFVASGVAPSVPGLAGAPLHAATSSAVTARDKRMSFKGSSLKSVNGADMGLHVGAREL